MKRLKPGQLVQITGGHRDPPPKPTLGIIVEVLERNDQNPDWDKFLVMWNTHIDALSGRRLKEFQPEILSQFVQKELRAN